MALLSTRDTRLGNLLKYEQASCHGYSRELATVVLTPESSIGDVLVSDGTNYALYTVLTSAADVAVLIDANIEALRPATGTATVECAVLVRSAIVVREQLTFGADVDTDAEVDAAIALLEAKEILVRTQV